LKKSAVKWYTALVVLLALVTGLAGCSATSSINSTSIPGTEASTPASTSIGTPAKSTPTLEQPANLLGAGATFPQLLYTKWFDEYFKLTGVKINYQGIGSGGGIQQITAGTVDFGASDGIMTAEQISAAEAKNGPVLHIPMTTGSVAVIFNLQGIAAGQLKLTGEVLANIYLKKIIKWDDPAITAINPGLNLPNTPIAVVHRSDGSGTTFIFTNYLSKVSEDWNTRIGNATSVNWPGDIGGQGSAGVTGQVQQIPNSIGYVELTYALQNQLPWAVLKNSSGNYEEPSLAGTSKAAENITLPDDMKIMITNSSNPEAYPICGFTWILAFANQPDKAKGQTLVDMLWWALHDGREYEQPLYYAPLSSTALTKAENEIRSIKYQGQPLFTR
jgi:phosphate transport system substrate-binding protein